MYKHSKYINHKEIKNIFLDLNRRFAKFPNKSLLWKIRYYWKKPQYRTLLYYRLGKIFKIKLIIKIMNFFYKRNSERYGLEINNTDLKGGVIIPHWGRIIINANSIGTNLYILHNVTIGDDYSTGRPTIGDNVFIGVNSIVIGGISIGDNVIISAGSTVISDIPSNSIVAGNPAKLIKEIDKNHQKQMLGY